MASYKFVALSVPIVGREPEFETWYDKQHIPDCLRLAGFKGAQRFRIDAKPVGADVPAWKYMVIYDIESDNIDATLAQIAKVARTAAMPMTDSMDMTAGLRFVAAPAAPYCGR